MYIIIYCFIIFLFPAVYCSFGVGGTFRIKAQLPTDLAGLLDEPPHHLLDVRPGRFGRVRVHGHARHPLVHPAAARPAQVQTRHLGVGHLRPVGGVDAGVGAGRLAGLVRLGLGLAVRLVLAEGLADGFELARAQEVAHVVLAEALAEGSGAAAQQLLQRRALLLAVVELRLVLRDLLVDVIRVQTHQLGLRHDPPAAAAQGLTGTAGSRST